MSFCFCLTVLIFSLELVTRLTLVADLYEKKLLNVQQLKQHLEKNVRQEGNDENKTTTTTTKYFLTYGIELNSDI